MYLYGVLIFSVSSNGTFIKKIFHLIKQTAIELNLFKSIPPSQDETILREERHQTRIYLVLLLTGLVILTLFTSIRPHTVTVTLKSPSLTNFIDLYKDYPVTLNCPCSQSTVQYDKLISYINPQYHEVCLSEFTSPRWISLQYTINPARIFFTNDIRYQSEVHFQLLSTLCRMANQTIEDNLQVFYQTKFVTDQVVAPSLFQFQVDYIVEQFKNTVPQSYQRTLQLIQANAEINQFIVPLNSLFESQNTFGKLIYGLTPAVNTYIYRLDVDLNLSTRETCVRLSASECILRTMISKGNGVVIIPGMFQTVFPLQSVLKSTLECFYNDSCLSKITQLINSVVSPTNFSKLQLSLLALNESPYDPIDTLANKLFIQSWNNKSSYQSYFNQCHPLTCQYTYESRFNIIYIVTTVIGLLGGLNIALRLVVPPIVKLAPQIWKKLICRQRNDVIPIVAVVPVRLSK